MWRILLLSGVVMPAVVWALEVPSTGLVYNTKDHSSISFSCNRAGESEIECEMVQTSIRKQANASDLPEKLTAARKEFASGKAYDADACKTTSQIVDVLEGRMKPPKGDVSQFTAIERKDLLVLGNAFGAFCKTPTESNYLALVRTDHEKQMRTCRVTSHSFKQTFRPAPNSDGRTWILPAQQPAGPCGIVQLDRFEAVDSRIGTPFWKYIARKAITNPNGSVILFGSCSALDQEEYEYDWKDTRQHGLGCDYITFTAF